MAEENINVDFTDVDEDGNFKPLPQGTYPVKVYDAEIRKSKESGAEYVNWNFIVITGDYKDRHIFDMTSLKQAALWRLKKLLRVLGMSGLDGKVNFKTDQLKGGTLKVKVVHEVYDGKVRDRVGDYIESDVAGSQDVPTGSEAVTEKDAKEIDKKMGKKEGKDSEGFPDDPAW